MADKVGFDFIVVLAAYPRILFHTRRNSRVYIYYQMKKAMVFKNLNIYFSYTRVIYYISYILFNLCLRLFFIHRLTILAMLSIIISGI